MNAKGGFSRGTSEAEACAEIAAGPAEMPMPPFDHAAVFYSSGGYEKSIEGFINLGLIRQEAVMVAVPRPNAVLLRGILGADADRVTFADLETLGRNPARIIPAIQEFAQINGDRKVRYVGEPFWPSQSPAERAEAVRHEALLNMAFAGQSVSMLCAFDTGLLDRGSLSHAERAHPAILLSGSLQPSAAYAGPGWNGDPPALSEAPAWVEALTYRDEPVEARTFARKQAHALGLPEQKVTDLVIAVGELAANTLRHTQGTGTVRLWASAKEVICEVRDSGHICDPLAGLRYPAPDAGRGHGLWVVQQVCDLVEMRTGGAGTTFRLHMKV